MSERNSSLRGGRRASPHSVMSVRNPISGSTRRAWSATVIASPFLVLTASTSGEVGLDVPAPVQVSDGVQIRVDAGEERTEVREPGRER